jgi:hypothetical protein
MQCHHCHSDMQQSDCVEDGGVRQTSFNCPVCNSSHILVQPCENPLQRLGNLLRCRSATTVHDWRQVVMR